MVKFKAYDPLLGSNQGFGFATDPIITCTKLHHYRIMYPGYEVLYHQKQTSVSMLPFETEKFSKKGWDFFLWKIASMSIKAKNGLESYFKSFNSR